LSIVNAEAVPDEVVVSDGSADAESTQTVCAEFDLVKYVRGTRGGVSANRNRAVDACACDYVGLLDDDAIVSTDFVSLGRAMVADAPPKTIFTGTLLEGETLWDAPGPPTFWGHYSARPRGRQKTIQLSCNLFPRSAFDVASFDEMIVYGYEDMDLCAQLLAAGYRIDHRPELLIQHMPFHRNEAEVALRNLQRTRARFYTTLKRHLIWQRSLLKVPAYIVLASVHEALHRFVRRDGLPPLGAFADMKWALVRAVRRARS
jgi:GT2 family glycosyltransferase